MKLKPLKQKFTEQGLSRPADKHHYEHKQTQKPMKRSNWRRVGKMHGEVCVLFFLTTSVCFAGPTFRVDKKIQYRLWINDSFADIARGECDDEGKHCKYQDYSAIDKIEIKNDSLMIYKRTSVWFLYNYKDVDNMMLRYGGERYLYE